jgi:hypothetical protein
MDIGQQPALTLRALIASDGATLNLDYPVEVVG